MNLNKLHEKLIAAARNHPPSDQVPYAFEQRIMARLAELPLADDWVLWARALWCGAGVCVAVALFIGVWSSAPAVDSESAAATFSQDLEQTILASADDGDNTW